MDKPLDENGPDPAEVGTDAVEVSASESPGLPTPEERRAERAARRKAAEANMSWDEIRKSRQARAGERRERLAALPEEQRAEKEAELARAKQARLSGRVPS